MRNVVVQGVSTPVSAMWIAGASTSLGESVQNRRRASARPATKPGVAAALKPARFASPRTFRQAESRGADAVEQLERVGGHLWRRHREVDGLRRRPARAIDKEDPPATDPAGGWLDDPEDEHRCHGGVHRVAAATQYGQAGLCRRLLLGHDHSGGRSRSRFADAPHARPGHAHLIDQCGQIAPPLKPRMIRPGGSVGFGLPVRECPT